MFDRVELKEKAKDTLRTNYWIIVLVALFAAVVFNNMNFEINISSNDAQNSMVYFFDGNNLPYVTNGDGHQLVTFSFGPINIGEISVERFEWILGSQIMTWIIVALITTVLLSVFVINPLQVGVARFFAESHHREVKFKEIFFPFVHERYLSIVKTMFLRDVYVFLWILLFIVPGIVKSYEYRMIPYLLAEDPYMETHTAFDMTKRYMDNNKWDTFVLDLSFFGWALLSAISFGIVGIFYLAPYQNLTNSALYLKLSSYSLE